MVNGIPVGGDVGTSAGEGAEVVVDSPVIRVEKVHLAGGTGLKWQRCQVADRVFVVTGGSGHCYRSHGRDEMRDEIRAGDVVYLRRMLWHRVVAAAGETLVGALVTTVPADVEFRR
jgi:quercetin dioxygenase-like cupin family protein